MNSYEISDDETTIRVSGTLKDDGKVQVEKNDEKYLFKPEQGDYSSGAVSCRLIRDDSGFIEEGAVTQEIRLPDGTRIEKGAVTRKADLPDGRSIESEASSGSERTTKIQSSNGSISIEISSSKTVVRQNSSSNNNVEVSTNAPKTLDDYIDQMNQMDDFTYYMFKVSQYTSAFSILTGVIYNTPVILSLGLLIFTASTLITAVVDRDKNEQEEDSEEKTAMSEEEKLQNKVENLKNKYKKGEIEEKEFEDKLEKTLNDTEKSLQMELS